MTRPVVRSGDVVADERNPRARRSDRLHLAAEILAIVLMIVFAVGGVSTLHRIGNDEREACERNSQRSAATVNVDWNYYLSERKLARQRLSPGRVQRFTRALSPGEQQFLLSLYKSSKPSRRILELRARADFDAAYANARTVDRHDLHMIRAHTALGSATLPRRWVIRAHYNCR